MTGADLQALEVCVLSDPGLGSVIPGGGGLRKCRFAVPGSGRGKRGAYRVFYVHIPEYGVVLLWAVIAKNDKADLSRDDLSTISRQIERFKQHLSKGVTR